MLLSLYIYAKWLVSFATDGIRNVLYRSVMRNYQNDFNELYESIYSKNLHHEPRKFVEFFDHNRILIEGQNISINEIIYDRVTRLKSDYAHSLIHNESHAKAKPEIDKALKLFENHPDYNEKDLLDIKYYETLIFDRAVVNFYSKNYKEAVEDFKTLTQKFPDDEKFRNWLKSTEAYKLVKFEKVLYIILAVTLFADLFLEDLNPLLDNLITVIFILGLSSIVTLEFVKWNSKR